MIVAIAEEQCIVFLFDEGLSSSFGCQVYWLVSAACDFHAQKLQALLSGDLPSATNRGFVFHCQIQNQTCSHYEFSTT